MALTTSKEHEEFVRCKKCDCPDFEEKEIVTPQKISIEYVENKGISYGALPTKDKEYKYKCRQCGKEYYAIELIKANKKQEEI